MLPFELGVRFVDKDEWRKWLHRLSPRMHGRIRAKLARLTAYGTGLGMPLVRRLTSELFELRVDKYRIYFVVGDHTVWILASGDKDSQRRDITRAQERI